MSKEMHILVSVLLGILYLFIGLILVIAIRVIILSRPTKGSKIKEYENPKKALLVIDIQEDYTGTTAKPPFPYKNTAVFIDKVNKVIEEASLKDFIIIYIGQECPDNIYYRLISAGRTIITKPGTKQDSRLKIISKNYFSKKRSDAFANSELDKFLISNQVYEIYITGIDAVFCAYKTAGGALNRNYKVSIIIDAVTTLTRKTQEELIEMYQKDGIRVIDSSKFIKEI